MKSSLFVKKVKSIIIKLKKGALLDKSNTISTEKQSEWKQLH